MTLSICLVRGKLEEGGRKGVKMNTCCQTVWKEMRNAARGSARSPELNKNPF